MEYEGIKFQTEFISNEVPINSSLMELISWCRIFHEKKLAPPYPGGSYGNLSFRIESGNNSFIITGSRIGLKNCLSSSSFVEVVECDHLKRLVRLKGNINPSSETILHDAIYKDKPGINAIFHGHCKSILNNAQKLGLPETATEQPYGTLELVESVRKVIDSNPILIMKNHGFISVAETMDKAGKQVLTILKKLKET